jgi:hypothetical protein
MLGKEANDQSANAIRHSVSAIQVPCSLVDALFKGPIEELSCLFGDGAFNRDCKNEECNPWREFAINNDDIHKAYQHSFVEINTKSLKLAVNNPHPSFPCLKIRNTIEGDNPIDDENIGSIKRCLPIYSKSILSCAHKLIAINARAVAHAPDNKVEKDLSNCNEKLPLIAYSQACFMSCFWSHAYPINANYIIEAREWQFRVDKTCGVKLSLLNGYEGKYLERAPDTNMARRLIDSFDK